MVSVNRPLTEAQLKIERVIAMHERLRENTADGQPYHGNDWRVLDWVQAGVMLGPTQASAAYAGNLTPTGKFLAFAEGAPKAWPCGPTRAPIVTNGESVVCRHAPSSLGSGLIART